MNKNRNKVAAMMMVAAITVSSVAMPVEAAVKNVNEVGINREKEGKTKGNAAEIRLTEEFFEDAEFRKYIAYKLKINENDIITQEQLDKVSEINLVHELPSIGKVKSLKGIKYFKNLVYLECSNNNISVLDLSSNDLLQTVECYGNIISELVLNDGIKYIDCSRNNMKELDLGTYQNLETLHCSYNKGLNLKNINKAINLNTLSCSRNEVESIDLSQNKNLVNLYLDNNNIQEINLSQNEKLMELSLSTNKLTDINLSNNVNLKTLDLENNKLTSIDLSKNTKIRNLFLSSNKIKKLDLTKLENLGIGGINISGNEIGKLDFSQYTGDNNKIEFTQYVGILSDDIKSIDLGKEFGITEEEANKKVKLIDQDGVKINGNIIEWDGRTPNRIVYTYESGGRYGNTQLEVHLYYPDFENRPPVDPKPPEPEKPNPDKPVNPNPDQGGSGGGTTTPDNKPDTKPEEKPNKPIELRGKIVGKNRYETAAKIADQMGSYNTVILVNSDKSMADGLSAASLSGKKNAPILLVKKNSIPSETMARLEKAENVYIIGGNNVISKKVENQLKGKKITRISGKDRYDTSAKIANLLGDYDTAFIVNGAKGEADAMSVSSVAAKYGAPILLTNGKTSKHLKKANVRYFVIGGKAVVSRALEDRYDADRISGVDRYSTNRKIIDEFYYDSKKVYFAKGDTLVDALAVSALAKEDGVVLVSKKANHKKLEGKKAIQVGGMDFEIDVK